MQPSIPVHNVHDGLGVGVVDGRVALRIFTQEAEVCVINLHL